jgi:hypothetical protein
VYLGLPILGILLVHHGEHRAELEAMQSPEGRQSLQSVIDSYERMIALIQRRAEKP